MKKMLFLGLLVGLYSCDDGDLQIEEVDFDAVSIQSCPGLDDLTQTTFFFKIDEDEALLLNLADGLLRNEPSEPGTLVSTIPGSSDLIYRFFSDNVTSAYFCDAIPPVEPIVVKENTATAGNISVDTKIDTLTADTKNYRHTINISDLSLTNDQGEQLTDLSTMVYGDFITSTPNSARLPEPFSNYAAITAAQCDPAPIAGTLRFTKAVSDEFIALDIPIEEDMFAFTTTDTLRTLDLSEDDLFKYVVLDRLSEDLACTDTFGENIRNWRFVSTSGTLSVSTVASAPDADGIVTNTHSISLEELVLSSEAEGATPVNLPVIPSVEFGTFATVQE